jgi:hypothetical protein
MADQAPAPVHERDWTVEVTDPLESVVGAVRDRTTVPATRAAQTVVFGLVAAILGLVALFLLVVEVVRILEVYLPIHPRSRRVWIADAIASAIFLGLGAFLWRKRQPKGS